MENILKEAVEAAKKKNLTNVSSEAAILSTPFSRKPKRKQDSSLNFEGPVRR